MACSIWIFGSAFSSILESKRAMRYFHALVKGLPCGLHLGITIDKSFAPMGIGFTSANFSSIWAADIG